MVRQLIWLNKENGKVCIRYNQFVSNFDIGDTNKYGHELINVIVFTKPITSISLKKLDLKIDKKLNKLTKSHKQKIKRGLIKLLKKMIVYLNKL